MRWFGRVMKGDAGYIGSRMLRMKLPGRRSWPMQRWFLSVVKALPIHKIIQPPFNTSPRGCINYTTASDVPSTSNTLACRLVLADRLLGNVFTWCALLVGNSQLRPINKLSFEVKANYITLRRWRASESCTRLSHQNLPR